MICQVRWFIVELWSGGSDTTANSSECKPHAIKINYINNAEEQRHVNLVREDSEGKIGLSHHQLQLYKELSGAPNIQYFLMSKWI